MIGISPAHSQMRECPAAKHEGLFEVLSENVANTAKSASTLLPGGGSACVRVVTDIGLDLTLSYARRQSTPEKQYEKGGRIVKMPRTHRNEAMLI